MSIGGRTRVEGKIWWVVRVLEGRMRVVRGRACWCSWRRWETGGSSLLRWVLEGVLVVSWGGVGDGRDEGKVGGQTDPD